MKSEHEKYSKKTTTEWESQIAEQKLLSEQQI